MFRPGLTPVPADSGDVSTLLNRLVGALHGEILELTFDYFELHTTCWSIMRCLEEKLGLRISFWIEGTHDQQKLPAFVHSLMSEPGVAGLGSEVLTDAGKILDGFLVSAGGAVIVKRNHMLGASTI